MYIILIVILLAVLLGGLPAAPWGTWQHGYGWYPSGFALILIVVLLVFVLTGRL